MPTQSLRKIPIPGTFSGKTSRFPEFEINGFDLIFASNLIILLVVLNILLSHTLGLVPLAVNSEALYLPNGLYTEVLLGPITPDNVIDDPEIVELDHSQFEAIEISNYVVQAGDTLGQISDDHNLNIDTIISFNQIRNVRRIQIGQELKIPNRNGLLHNVEGGDSLRALAQSYNSDFNAILDTNSLFTEDISPGQTLFIPGARMDSTELRLVLGELFIYPTIGRFTSGYGYRNDPFTGDRRFHNGLDFANVRGTAVRAAMDGRVVHIETQIGNYGRFIIVQHAGGFQSLYAHLDSVSVRRGDYVYQGETIGGMGNTGRSTGNHLHFSIIRYGAFVDPLAYLH